MLATFIQRQKDPEYVSFIRQSNANCNYASQAICCPSDETVTPKPPSETPVVKPPSQLVGTRLLTPEEGCGVSKVPHNRVVGGVPAKKGE